MTILKRINTVQCNLMQKELPKTGHNKFQNFKYYELEDILAPITCECSKHNLFLHFTFTEDRGVLTVKDFEGTAQIVTTVPLPNIQNIIETEKDFNFKKLKNDLIQAQGSYITYAKRYLLINLFLICEEDHIDMFSGKSEDVNIKDEPDTKIPQPIITAKKVLEENGLPFNRMNVQEVITFSDLTPSERKETIQYIKRMC